MSKIRLAAPCNIDSIVDGPGLRIVIWTQGCPHHCPFCHNPQTHDYQKGFEEETDKILHLIDQVQLQSGITLSGGEPFEQCEALIEIAQYAKQKKLNVWAYSGYTYDEILADEKKKKLLQCLDVLVDGKFDHTQKHHALKFKGSKNQRIIDVQASLKENKVILSPHDESNQNLLD